VESANWRRIALLMCADKQSASVERLLNAHVLPYNTMKVYNDIDPPLAKENEKLRCTLGNRKL